MIDALTIAKTATSIGWWVTMGEFTEAKPMVVRLRSGRAARLMGGGTFNLWRDRCHNEVEVVRLGIRVGQFSSYRLDVEHLRNWIHTFVQSAPIGTPILTETGPEGYEWEINLVHTLAGDDLTEKTFEQTVIALCLTSRVVFDAVRAALRSARAKRQEKAERADATAAVLGELDALVGLAPVKSAIRTLTAQQKIAALRSEAGLKPYHVSPHLVFTGNPGTGKTTVARLVGRLYQSLGLLEKGHVVEVERSTLVAPYLGQTALKATEQFERALGGVLFIDEAYSLVTDGRDYGREVIETLLTFMESHRGEVAVVVAGYPKEMQRFIDSNPGLRSRFDLTLPFPDLTDRELFEVFTGLLMAHDYRLEPEAIPHLKRAISTMPRGQGFGNAREIERFFNRVVCNHAAALAPTEAPSAALLQAIGISEIVTSAPWLTTVPEVPREPMAAGYL